MHCPLKGHPAVLAFADEASLASIMPTFAKAASDGVFYLIEPIKLRLAKPVPATDYRRELPLTLP
jgi:hypothetical protein